MKYGGGVLYSIVFTELPFETVSGDVPAFHRVTYTSTQQNTKLSLRWSSVGPTSQTVAQHHWDIYYYIPLNLAEIYTWYMCSNWHQMSHQWVSNWGSELKLGQNLESDSYTANRWRWPRSIGIGPRLGQHLFALSLWTTIEFESILSWCWPTFCDVGPASNQHWLNVSCLLGGLYIYFTYIGTPSKHGTNKIRNK